MDATPRRPLDVVIVGAPRSGTNMLRDVLTSLPGVATWPCDEINLVWRHGNRSEPSDELTAQQARPAVAAYVRGQFEKVRGRCDSPVVVEKTCATSLRVEFTRAVLPDAKYLFITRDGIDAAASSMDRWHAPFDLRYTAAKARFVPPSDLPYYGARFVATSCAAEPRGPGRRAAAKSPPGGVRSRGTGARSCEDIPSTRCARSSGSGVSTPRGAGWPGCPTTSSTMLPTRTS